MASGHPVLAAYELFAADRRRVPERRDGGNGQRRVRSGQPVGELFDQYDGDRWVGCLSDRDLERVDTEGAVFPTGPAGSVTVHNCRTIHGSAPNRSDSQRPLLLQTYSAADAFVYTDRVRRSPRGDTLIRGKPARWARHDPRPCQVGPSRAHDLRGPTARNMMRRQSAKSRPRALRGYFSRNATRAIPSEKSWHVPKALNRAAIV